MLGNQISQEVFGDAWKSELTVAKQDSSRMWKQLDKDDYIDTSLIPKQDRSQ
jgi:hypothetical protein